MTANTPNASRPTETGAPQTNGAGKASSVRERASEVEDHAVDASKRVAQTSKERASDVVEEAKSQAQDLLGQTRNELRDQAEHQQRRIAEGLHAMSDEFSQMARDSESGGLASEAVHNAARRTGAVANWLEDRDPGSLLAEVRRFAGRKPGTFIAVSAAAGLLAGRLTRSVASNASDESGSTATANTVSTGADAESAEGSGPELDSGVAATQTPVYSSLIAGETLGDDESLSGKHLNDEYVADAGTPEGTSSLSDGATSAERPFGEES